MVVASYLSVGDLDLGDVSLVLAHVSAVSGVLDEIQAVRHHQLEQVVPDDVGGNKEGNSDNGDN
jgi:hypothetical protein